MPPITAQRYIERLHQIALEQADDLKAATTRILGRSVVGSPADKDFKTVARSTRSDDRQYLWGAVQMSCLHLDVNVHDHVRSIALLLSQPANGLPVYAHATVARVAIESAAILAYIHDNDSPFEVRFARGVALLIDDSDAALSTAGKIPANAYLPAPGPVFAQRHKDLLDVIDRARIELVLSPRTGNPKGVRVGPGAPEVPINVKPTELVAARYPKLPGMYKLLSGVVHGQPHVLRSNVRITERRGQWDPDPLDVGASVLAAMHAAHTAVHAHAWHRGQLDDAALANMAGRISAVDELMKRFGRDHMRLPRPDLVSQFMTAP